MHIIHLRRATLLGLAVALFTAALLPASANRRGPGDDGPGGGRQPSIPAGSVGVRANITAVDATAGTLQITDRNGLSVTVKTASSTVIQLDGKTATLADLKVNDAAIVVYDRTTLVASQILASSSPPIALAGTITSLDTTAGTVGVTTDHGTAITLTVKSSSQIRLNGSATTLANLAVGQAIRATYHPADKIALTIQAETPRAGIVSGAITALDLTAGTLQLTPLVGAAQTMTLNAQISYRLNGRLVTPAGIAVGDLAAVQVGTNNTVTILAAETPPLIDLQGTISALNVQGGTVQVTTQATTSITLLLGSATTVQLNNAASTADKLAIGDQVEVEYEYRLVPNSSRALEIVAKSAAPATTPSTTPTTPSAAVVSITLNPASVTGGTASTATITLTAAAPTGGARVTLASSNPAVAAVPGSVTVLANATSMTVSVPTTTVTTATTVTLFASYGGATGTATLTVNP